MKKLLLLAGVASEFALGSKQGCGAYERPEAHARRLLTGGH
jgi:hypothetical protein